MRFRGWLDKGVRAGSSHPPPRAGTSDFLAFLDGEFNYLIIFGRKMLACGWINQSICRRGSRWDGLSWSSVSLAGFSLLHLLASPVFCILLQCDFIWKLHMQWDITLFQVKLDCSCIGSVVKLHLGDNSKYFPDLSRVCISYFSLQCQCVLGCSNMLLWKAVVIQLQSCLLLIFLPSHAHPFCQHAGGIDCNAIPAPGE